MSKFLYKLGITLWVLLAGITLLILLLGWINRFDLRSEDWAFIESWFGGLGLLCFILGWVFSIWEDGT